MNFRKVNNITGWVILVIAVATYTITREPTASFWDCGEFIAVANELGVPHPPGSPLFSMLGRLFIVLFSGGDAANAAKSVNLLSAVASGFTILFLFWTITHFARKMFVNHGENLTASQTFTVMASGVVGALAYTFSDTFWFSAVEGEVYALSSFFTALIIWAMLKWEHAYELAKDVVEKNRADRWIVFIFFMLGLAITVHLLNLLTLPAIVMIYYFRKYTPSVGKSILAFLISCGMTGLMLWALVTFIPKASAAFDRLFVNNFGLSFFTGFAFFFVLIGALCWLLLRVAKRYSYSGLRLGVWCFLFILLGYSTYVTTLIRSHANPAIDMSNVDNPASLASYFGREQYGSSPLITGPHFGARPIGLKEKSMRWGKLGNKYIKLGPEVDYEFRAEDEMFFPRIWDITNQQNHQDFYRTWLNKTPVGQDPTTGAIIYDPPITYKDNISWFFSYQMSLMYWRYFMWNFSGRQNDLQGFGNRRDGNWQTGIGFIDSQLLGDQSKLPQALKENKANNKLYLLPFLIGVLGCVYHFIKKKNDWVVNFLLFFFTGIAIALYLNMPGNQPRERDYAFAGSFYAYAVWIGLGVVSLVKLAKETSQNLLNTVLYGVILTLLITAFSLFNFPGRTVLIVSMLVAAVYAALALALPQIIKAISNKGENEKIAGIGAAAICMIVPLLMASTEWDDHDRGNKTLARDNAKNYLESCPKDAILFSFGDNDTYPLWYAQEVENVRPDIRIINTSLLGIDWYINQLRYKINESDSVDVIWSPEQIIGDRRAQLGYNPPANVSRETYYDLYRVMKEVLGVGENAESFPVKKFRVPVDSAVVRKNGTINADDVFTGDMLFELPANSNSLRRDELIVLNIIASNKWKRPVCFTSPQIGLGLAEYMRTDGLTYRLTPIKANMAPNTDWMKNVLMTKFTNGNADKKGVYFDEENRRHLYGIRNAFADVANDLVDKKRLEEAKQVVLKADSLIPDLNIPYAMPSRVEFHNDASYKLMQAAYASGATDLAKKINQQLNKDLNEQIAYYASLGEMTPKQLENILMQYNQQRYMEQMQQKDSRQSDAYLSANLSFNQSGLATEMNRTFGIMQYVQGIEERYNPKPKDTTVNKDTNLPKPTSTDAAPKTTN